VDKKEVGTRVEVKKGNAMNHRTTLLVTFILALSFVFAASAMAGDAEYIGATKCKMCHNTAKQGEIYKIWSATAHAKAYETLAGEKAKEVAKAKGIEDPQKAEACLKCHVTGYGVKDELKGEKYSIEEGVTCEACHGAGGNYWKMSTMKAIAAGEIKPDSVGLVLPDEKTCVKCHNEQSPTFKGFKFADAWPKIEHKIPSESE